MNEFSQWIGRTEEHRDRISQAGVDQFRATFDLDPASDNPGEAPKGYHWCLGLPDTPTPELGLDGHPPKGGFLPPIPFPRRMWAASSVEFLTELPIGAQVVRRSKIFSVQEKTGKSGPLVLVQVEHQTEVEGQCAIKERQTIVYREQATSAMELPPVEKPQSFQYPLLREVLPTQTLLFRYSALTFNSHRIHYDLPYAMEQEGYPGLVVHGPLMASLGVQAAAAHGDLKTFSFRALSPAFCDQPLYVVGDFDKDTQEVNVLGGDGRRCVSAQVTFKQ